eukprot:2381026-Amphidinium_carterae.1
MELLLSSMMSPPDSARLSRSSKRTCLTRVSQNALRALEDTAVLEHHTHFEETMQHAEIESLARTTGALLYRFVDLLRQELSWEARSRIAMEDAAHRKRNQRLKLHGQLYHLWL